MYSLYENYRRGNVVNNDFFVMSYKDILDKCKEELKQLGDSSRSLKYEYRLLNLILSINHLFDWVLTSDLCCCKKDECAKKFNPYCSYNKVPHAFQIYYSKSDFPEKNHEQAIIRNLSNNSKHNKIGKKETLNTTKNNTAMCGNSCMGDAYLGDFSGYSTDSELTSEFVEDICKKLVDDWDRFLTE